MTYTTNLYFECHVKLKPVDEKFKPLLKKICDFHKFRVAKLLMQKGVSAIDAFCTTRSTSYKDIVVRTQYFIAELKINGFDVTRYKVENTLLDSNVKDIFSLLVAEDEQTNRN